MLKIAFLGSDSTHTEAFGARINAKDGRFCGRARVVSMWGEDPELTALKASNLAIQTVARTPADALRNADLAMVIGRFGSGHFEPAAEALARGIPTFVDKPLTCSRAEAQELVDRSRRTGVPLTSSSPLRFARELQTIKHALASSGGGWTAAVATGPATCIDLGNDPRLDTAFFYGIHATEMLLELVGHDISDVKVLRGRTATTAHIEVSNGRTAVLQLWNDLPESYSIELHSPEASERARIELDGSYYDGLLSYVLEEFPRGRRLIPIESTLNAIWILDAVDTAIHG